MPRLILTDNETVQARRPPNATNYLPIALQAHPQYDPESQTWTPITERAHSQLPICQPRLYAGSEKCGPAIVSRSMPEVECSDTEEAMPVRESQHAASIKPQPQDSGDNVSIDWEVTPTTPVKQETNDDVQCSDTTDAKHMSGRLCTRIQLRWLGLGLPARINI